LLYCLGEEAEDILVSTGISNEHWKEYSQVLSKFDTFFHVRKNVIIERAKFNRRFQLPEEPADQFVATLYNLATDCQYRDLKNEIIRDRIVVGIRDVSLSERLQMDPGLTLQKAKTIFHQREAIRDQQCVIKGHRVDSSIDAVSRTPRTKSRRSYKSDGPKKYLRCGKSPSHPDDSCPARCAKCHRCGKIGHFRAVCLTKPLNMMEECDIQTEPTQDPSTVDSFFLDTVKDPQNSKYLTATVFVNDSSVSYKLDTGAEFSAITEKSLELLGSPD